MTELKYTTPTVGEKVTVAEPLVDTALNEIKAFINGKNLDSTTNIKAEGVAEAALTAALQTKINEKTAGGTTSKSIIATEQSREAVGYGTLSTPDEVEVEMTTNGLFAIWYQAHWEESINGAARAAIFLGANQLRSQEAGVSGSPVLQEASLNSGIENKSQVLATCSIGLASTDGIGGTSASGADVTTGQVVGGGILGTAGVFQGGPCWVFAAAAKYKISVQFKASAGKVVVKSRKLWVLAFA